MSGAEVVMNADYFMANPEAFDALTEAQQVELLQNGSVTTAGDTDGSASPDTTADVNADDKAGEVGKDVLDDGKAEDTSAEPTGILSKDGQHVIPFSRLTEAQEEAARFRALATQQEQIIADLKAAKEADAGTGDTKAQDDVLEGLRSEFPELAEKLAPVISALVDQGVNAAVSKLNAEIQPLKANAQEDAVNKHFNTIRDAHSDFDTLIKGDAVEKWIDKQPAFVQDRYKEVLEKGTAKDVVELLSAYKEANKISAPSNEPSSDDIKLAAKNAVDKAKGAKAAPLSLSEVPSGQMPASDELTAMDELSPTALMAKFEGKTPEQINAIISKII